MNNISFTGYWSNALVFTLLPQGDVFACCCSFLVNQNVVLSQCGIPPIELFAEFVLILNARTQGDPSIGLCNFVYAWYLVPPDAS